MNRYKYIKIPFKNIPNCIMKQWNLAPLVQNDHIIVETRKWIYGLPQAKILANNQLVKHLSNHDYHSAKLTPGIFRPKHRSAALSLVVDNFGLRYMCKENTKKIINTLWEKYTITMDKEET